MSSCAGRGARWDPIDQSDTPKAGAPDRESGWLRPKGSASGRGDVSPSSEVADVCKKVHTWSREGEHALPPPFLVLAVQKGDAANAIAAPNLAHPFPFLCPFESAGSLELISQPGPVQIRERDIPPRREGAAERMDDGQMSRGKAVRGMWVEASMLIWEGGRSKLA